MAMKMMRSVLMLLAVTLVFGACVRTSGSSDEVTLTRGELQSMLQKNRSELLDNFGVAAAKFYEETSDSYYILSYEYYKLSKELAAQGKKEQAENFKQLSAICLEHQKDLLALAAKHREGLSPVTKAMEPKVPTGAPTAAQGTVRSVSSGASSQPVGQRATIAGKPQMAAAPRTVTPTAGSGLVKPAMQQTKVAK